MSEFLKITNDDQLIANQLIKFSDYNSKQKIEQLLKNTLSMSEHLNIDTNEVMLNIVSNVFNRLMVLDEHVLSIQPMEQPVGSLSRMVRTRNGFEINEQDIEAATRKFQVNLPLELCDVTKYHDLDPKIEISKIVSQEVFYEITSELMHLLYELASQTNKHVIKHSETKSKYDEHIRTISDSIKSNTGRGLPNFVIVNKLGLAVLIRLYNFQQLIEVKNTQDISYIGTVNLEPFGSTQINVLLAEVAEFASNTKPILLFGYKSSTVDTGFFYCPYTLCHPAGITVGELDARPRASFATRYTYSPDLWSSDPEVAERDSHFFGIIEGPVETSA